MAAPQLADDHSRMRALDSSIRFPRSIHSRNTPRRSSTEPALKVDPLHGSRNNSAAPQLSLHTTGTPHIRASFTTAPQPSYLLGSRSKSMCSIRLPTILLLTAFWNRIRLATPPSTAALFQRSSSGPLPTRSIASPSQLALPLHESQLRHLFCE